MLTRAELEHRLAAAEVLPTPGKARWAAGGVAGGGISTAALANVLAWLLPEGAPALDIAALLVGIGGLLVTWWAQRG